MTYRKPRPGVTDDFALHVPLVSAACDSEFYSAIQRLDAEAALGGAPEHGRLRDCDETRAALREGRTRGRKPRWVDDVMKRILKGPRKRFRGKR